MIKWLICLLWGHCPWKVLAETVYQGQPIEAIKLPSYKGDPRGFLPILQSFERLARGEKVITLTCERCSQIETIVQ
jgi:hypothetical protein